MGNVVDSVAKGAQNVYNGVAKAVNNVVEDVKETIDKIADAVKEVGKAFQNPIGAICIAATVWMVCATTITLAIIDALTGPDSDLPTLAAPGSAPYQVSIQLDGMHLCGGCLVDEEHVLTLGTCVGRYVDKLEVKRDMRIYVGTVQIPNVGDYYIPTRIILHNNFKPGLSRSNLAIVRLEKKVSITDIVDFIKLPEKEGSAVEKKELVTSGYERSSAGGSDASYSLHVLKMEIPSAETCKKNRIKTDGQFCALPSERYPHCRVGDGSVASIDNRNTALGLALGGSCSKGTPEWFLDLSKYSSWIRETIS